MAMGITKKTKNNKILEDNIKSEMYIAFADEMERRGYRVFEFVGEEWHFVAIRPGSLKFVQVSMKPLYDRGAEYNRKLRAFPMLPGASKEYWRYEGQSYNDKPIFNIKIIGNGEKHEINRDFTRNIKTLERYDRTT